MKRFGNTFWPLLLGASAMGLPASAAGPVRYPIHADQVARAVFAAHPELAGDLIDLPESAAARESEPVLEAGPVERWGGTASATAHVRMRCQGEGACLPFYASVHLPDAQAVAAPAVARREQTAHTEELHSGERVSMVIDSGLLHLRIPVTCLGSGAVGSVIRVAGPSRSKVYEASVVDGNTVRGRL